MSRRQTEFFGIFAIALVAQVIASALDPGISDVELAVGMFAGSWIVAWAWGRMR